ncbi:cytochrome P450 [Dendrothele bispora CBS 962.96]|uniref:Cytochrome P450 n=1 Tax=Dendrothele bispora (strain CBS 962.96) TaxID=1314807 RepID=A0A4S8LQY2_DENBC|nr:cytochrome P450 [Dendrothele bispora CBS 962.96]
MDRTSFHRATVFDSVRVRISATMDTSKTYALSFSGVLGILNHVAFRYYEPSPTKAPLSALILFLEPFALWLAFLKNSSSTGPESEVLALATIYVSFGMSLAASIVLYRLSPFHPLANVPGPAYMKVSKAYLVWISFRGDRYRVLKALHDKYGSVIRTGPNQISVCEVDGLIQVLGPTGLPKGKAYSVRQINQSIPQSVVVANSTTLHAKKRRLWNRGMSMQAIRDYEPSIVRRGRQLRDGLVKRSEEGSVDLVKWINYFTFDFMSDMAFGGGSEMLREGKDTGGLWGFLESHAKMTDILAQVPWLSHFAYKCLTFRFAQVGVKWASDRIKRGASTKDLWYHLRYRIVQEIGFEQISLREIVSEGVVAILAGSDTTSSVLACLFWLLLAHSEYYSQVREEVDKVYPPGSDCMDVTKHGELVLLGACLNEAMRLFPPTPTNGPREVPVGSGGKFVAGYFLPEGMEVLVPPYVIHRNPTYFSNPDSFLPERWLDPESKIRSSIDPDRLGNNFKHNTAAYIPFSYGPRNCVGRALARQEMLMIAGMLIRELEFEFAKGFDWEAWPRKLDDHWVTIRGDLNVDVTVRGL